MLKVRPAVVAVLLVAGAVALTAQQKSASPEFDVVWIKPNLTANLPTLPPRRLADGSIIATNMPIAFLIGAASPVPISRGEYVVGLPDWTRNERYDITVKPPAGVTDVEQQRPMWRALFADRPKLRTHTMEQERNTYALLLARQNGRLGPQLTLSRATTGGDDTLPELFTAVREQLGLTLRPQKSRRDHAGDRSHRAAERKLSGEPERFADHSLQAT